ncbi:SUMF1/EgtB/PvdO family nonheme iron enzyme [Nostoc sp.]|uniref:SUMF1/EgtB/PvdO family nonheme iron enzyme n=1 Tax=Nostoc sp. TaxID=1180 RepID=UPI003FA576BE
MYAPADASPWMSDNDNRVLRGGSWYYVSKYSRSANRGRDACDYRSSRIGFRIVVAAPLMT